MRLDVEALDGRPASDEEVAALLAALERLMRAEPAHAAPPPVSRWRLAGRAFDEEPTF